MDIYLRLMIQSSASGMGLERHWKLRPVSEHKKQVHFHQCASPYAKLPTSCEQSQLSLGKRDTGKLGLAATQLISPPGDVVNLADLRARRTSQQGR